MPGPRFDMQRACFYLLAVIILVEVASTVFAGISCFYTNMITVRQIGACMPIAQLIREQWSEILTAVLALLLAGRRSPPPDDGKDGDLSS